ncbi:DUF4412 domain-containing protein [Flavihumibacter solisilvae]|uniref:DUF4412 domain-containing protein n=1 Tax=Flavihumibacter solisilvae TaxID=1349421 RepID=A0A0C1L9R8_9BACT|nr:DUF4412 domain-containing protein [Flavihumibacter solisilvae]KIC96276.1 hypothetical protein OI18_00465 [Flavihumibacter solisilvae]
MKRSFLLFALLQVVFVCSGFSQEYKDFNFKSGITYSMSNSSNSGPNEMTMWFADNQYSGVEMGGQSAFFMVYDMKNQAAVNIMPAQKMYMVMDLKKMKEKMKSKTENPDSEKPVITKTGKTEKILGYNCEQYLIKTNKSESLVWVTKDLGIDGAAFAKSFGEIMGNQDNSSPINTYGLSGVMMKMEVTEKDSKEKATLVATKVHKDGKSVDVTGFKKMNMPGQ